MHIWASQASVNGCIIDLLFESWHGLLFLPFYMPQTLTIGVNHVLSAIVVSGDEMLSKAQP